MTGFWIPLLAGALTGVLSGFGIGGGTLLLIYMTAFAGLEQTQAQGINLLYFLPAAGASLPSHLKNGFIEKHAVLPGVLCGLIASGLAAWAATAMDVALLRRGFGLFLIVIGLRELFRKSCPAREGK